MTLYSTFRIRKGYPCESRAVAQILPAFINDFFSPQDIINKVIGEFLSNQQPHPQLMASVLFKVKTYFSNKVLKITMFISRIINLIL